MSYLNNNEPLVSIIVPVYNSGDYIKGTLMRLLNQSYKNIEVVVVDDGSTDQTLKVINEISYDGRLKLVQQFHSGVSIARNTGMNNSSGKFISFVDSDDFVSKDYVSVLMRPFLSKNNKSIVMSIGKFKTVDRPQNNFIDKKTMIEMNPSQALEQLLMQKDDTDVSLSSRIYRVSSLNGLRVNEGIVFEDLDYNVRYLAGLDDKSVVAFVDAVVLEYYQRTDSIMHRNFTDEEMTILQVVDNVTLAVENSDIGVRRALNNKLISTLAGVYSRSVIDDASYDKQMLLYHCLSELSKNFTLKKPRTLKSVLIVMALHLGKSFSKIILCMAYKATKKI